MLDLQENLLRIKRETILCVHGADFIGRDHSQHSYWVFAFDQSRVYRCSPDNKTWTFASCSIAQLVASLRSTDPVLDTLRLKLSIYEKSEPISDKVNFSFRYRLAQILNYKVPTEQSQNLKRRKEEDGRYVDLLTLLCSVEP